MGNLRNLRCDQMASTYAIVACHPLREAEEEVKPKGDEGEAALWLGIACLALWVLLAAI